MNFVTKPENDQSFHISLSLYPSSSSETKLRTLPLLVMLVLLALLALSASLTCACPSIEYLEKTTVTEVSHHHLSLLINCKGLQKTELNSYSSLFTGTTYEHNCMGDDGRKRKRVSTPEPENGGTLAPVIEMSDEGSPGQEEVTLSKALADAGKSGTFSVIQWEGILDLISKSVKRGKQMSIAADLPCPFSGCGEKHKTYKDWFKHMKQHLIHNLFQQEEPWKSIATDQLKNIGGLKYCQKCHEPWNANGLARHETSCRKNIESAQTMTSEAANQDAAAV